ncbi:hypothetical protein S7711_06967 [Stachybotrys chartarum IBT 7711]|uniref:Membrane insertase YidC/Oxa/ALB C-terminal domain-containing protein n=1 Tax=Stachybotrys chartarum (strain CBS 109288 / IBT 7711) TaxID=1280523 RepID=A0A084ARX8_STACB|nr:hypothetical protein S7711_06967 [Stachybotrys chartarum IBT 7711]KFA46498.1 hypothetical protein S40293_04233 [Stachybotrys chartarum IBT 40293]
MQPGSRLPTPTNGRQFGTSMRGGSGAGLTASTPTLRLRYAAAPVVLGGVQSSRNLSLWGYGTSSKPAEAPATPEPVEAAPQTAAPTPDPVPQQTFTEPSVVPTEVDFKTLSDIVTDQDIMNMPENLGYLHAMGLDFGWGPTSVMQWLLEHVHVYSGMGWGFSIIATAALLRLLLVYPTIQSSIFQAKMLRVKEDPRSKEAMDIIKQSVRKPDGQADMVRGRFLNKMVMKEHGVSNLGMLWGFLPIPFSFGLFRLLNGMAAIPVPSLETDGFLWFTNLAVADPYYILPALSVGSLVAAMKLNAKYTPPEQQAMMKSMTWVMGALGFSFTIFFSAAVNLMGVTVGASTVLTTLLLNNSAIRRSLGIPERTIPAPAAPSAEVQELMYEAPRPPPATGLAAMRERLSKQLGDAKKGLDNQMSSMTGVYRGNEQDRAEKDRVQFLKKFEEERREKERLEFEQKYKSRRRG